MGLYTLIYTSAAAPDVSEEDIDDILRNSRRQNAARDVTGVLYFQDGSFIQVLEGPQDAIEATMSRIRMDERHTMTSILYEAPIETRGFPFWTMGYPKADEDGAFDINTGMLRDIVEKDADTIARVLLSNFLKVSGAETLTRSSTRFSARA